MHRSQSFHTTNIADLTLDYSSEETEDDHITLPIDPMITSTHSDILDLRKDRRRQANDSCVMLEREYITGFQVCVRNKFIYERLFRVPYSKGETGPYY